MRAFQQKQLRPVLQNSSFKFRKRLTEALAQWFRSTLAEPFQEGTHAFTDTLHKVIPFTALQLETYSIPSAARKEGSSE
jgi:hypothetical protein